mgnify:CR=1 FL=1
MAEEHDDTEEMFEKALDMADESLDSTLNKAGPLAPYVAVAMIEAAVNRAVDATSPEDVISILQDLIAQIEADIGDEDGAAGALDA